MIRDITDDWDSLSEHAPALSCTFLYKRMCQWHRLTSFVKVWKGLSERIFCNSMVIVCAHLLNQYSSPWIKCAAHVMCLAFCRCNEWSSKIPMWFRVMASQMVVPKSLHDCYDPALIVNIQVTVMVLCNWEALGLIPFVFEHSELVLALWSYPWMWQQEALEQCMWFCRLFMVAQVKDGLWCRVKKS